MEMEIYLYNIALNKKNVSFDTKNHKVHKIIAWDFAYRQARKGYWEDVARDRFRFNMSIQNLASILNPILDETHRRRIYNERFHYIV
jgi:hypothetical protein